jgi:hypothetical protein
MLDPIPFTVLRLLNQQLPELAWFDPRVFHGQKNPTDHRGRCETNKARHRCKLMDLLPDGVDQQGSAVIETSNQNDLEFKLFEAQLVDDSPGKIA